MGITSAPEIYQRIMDTMLEGIPGCKAIMDDILVDGKDETEHDRILKQVIQKATEWNLRFNFAKCQVRRKRVPYCGHTVTADGLEAHDDKVHATKEMPVPRSKEDVHRLLGMVQYLGKCLLNMSTQDVPLREVIKKEVDFFWLEAQQHSWEKLKGLCSKMPVQAHYNAAKELTIQCDASSYGLGGVLLQEDRPIA